MTRQGRKRLKLILLIFTMLALLMLIGVSAVFAFAQTNIKTPLSVDYVPDNKESGIYDSEGNLTSTWDDLISTGMITISGSSITDVDTTISGELVIPNNITTIGSSAFSGCSNLTRVVTGNGVTTIGTGAFGGCTSLTSLVIGPNVSSMDLWVTWNCYNLESVEVKNPNGWSVTQHSADSEYTQKKQFSTTDFSANAALINYYSNGDYSWTRVPVESYKTAGLYYSNDNLNLTWDTLTSTGMITVENNVITSVNTSISGKLVIADTVTGIGNSAFAGCGNLISVTIPNSVTSVSSSAFRSCYKLVEVYNWSIISWYDFSLNSDTRILSPGDPSVILTSYGLDFFEYETGKCKVLGACDNDDEAWVYATHDSTAHGVTVTGVREYAFYGNDKITHVYTSFGLTSIGDYAFYGCSALETVFEPASLTSIGNYAFYGCSALTSFSIPENVATIGNFAFDGCSSLTSINIPNNVTSIGDYAFSDCSKLTNIYISTGVTSIGDYAFSDCLNLTSINIPYSVTTLGDVVFMNCYKLVQVHNLSSQQIAPGGDCGLPSDAEVLLSTASIVIYTDNNGLQYFEYETGKYKVLNYTGTASEITIPATVNGKTVTDIRVYAFYKNTTVTRVSISSGIATIGARAFYECSKLSNVVMGDSVTSIGDYAFYQCSSLTFFAIESGVKDIGCYAFLGCSNLTRVVFVASGWYVRFFGGVGSGSSVSIDTTDFSESATLLTSTYSACYWYRS